MQTFADGALLLTFEGAAACLTLNRPAFKNAFNTAMWRALPEAVAAVEARAEARVLVVRGAGGAFASGADISEFPDVFADADRAKAYGRLMERASGALAGCSRPVLAQIEGFCIGAGLAAALACDLRIAADSARFSVPPARLGVLYSLTDTRRLVQAVGASTARSMLFTARMMEGAEALRCGLVDELHADAALSQAVSDRVETIAGLSAWTHSHSKRIIAQVLGGAAEDTDETRTWFAQAGEGEDFRRAVGAFLKRNPPG